MICIVDEDGWTLINRSFHLSYSMFTGGTEWGTSTCMTMENIMSTVCVEKWFLYLWQLAHISSQDNRIGIESLYHNPNRPHKRNFIGLNA